MDDARKNKGLAASTSAERASDEPFLLFESQDELPGIPAPTRSCLQCGAEIPAPKREGRPIGFCSETCRRERAVAQRVAWREAHPERQRALLLTCWSCGSTFARPTARQGRLPRFCSEACRHEGRNRRSAAARRKRDRVRLRAKSGHDQVPSS